MFLCLSALTNLTKMILIAFVVITLLVVMFKYPNGRIFILAIFAIAFVAFTVYAGVQLDSYYNSKGGIIGQISQLYNPNQVQITDNVVYNFENVMMTQDTGDLYSATIESSDVLEINLDENVNYSVYVNGQPCDSSEVTSDYVVATYKYSFKDFDVEEITHDTLTFKFAFYSNSTLLKVSTTGGANAVKYWNYYFNKNTFVVSIDNKGFRSPEGSVITSGDVSNYALVKYHNTNGLEKTEVLTKGSKITYVSSVDLFEYWLDGETIVDENYVVSGDVTLVANTTPVYTITYKTSDGEVIETTSQAKGLTVDLITPNSEFIPEGCAFEGWSVNGELIDNSYIVTGDVELVAVWSELVDIHVYNQGELAYTKSVKVGSDLTCLTALERDGYTFEGFSLDGKTKLDETTVVDNDITLYALWGHLVSCSHNSTVREQGLTFCVYYYDSLDKVMTTEDTIFYNLDKKDHTIDLTRSTINYAVCPNGSIGVEGESPILFTLDSTTLGSFVQCSGQSDTNLQTTGSLKIKVDLDGTLTLDAGDYAVRYKGSSSYTTYISIYVETCDLYVISAN